MLESGVNWMAIFNRLLTSDRLLLIWGNFFLGGCNVLQEAIKRQALNG